VPQLVVRAIAHPWNEFQGSIEYSVAMKAWTRDIGNSILLQFIYTVCSIDICTFLPFFSLESTFFFSRIDPFLLSNPTWLASKRSPVSVLLLCALPVPPRDRLRQMLHKEAFERRRQENKARRLRGALRHLLAEGETIDCADTGPTPSETPEGPSCWSSSVGTTDQTLQNGLAFGRNANENLKISHGKN